MLFVVLLLLLLSMIVDAGPKPRIRMIPDIVQHARIHDGRAILKFAMLYLKLFHTGELVLMRDLQFHNVLSIGGVGDLQVFVEQHLQMIHVVMFIGTAVVFPTPGSVPQYNFGTIVGCIRGSLTLLTVHVSYVVGIFLLELFVRNRGKMTGEEE